MGGVKIYGGVTFITTLPLFHFVRNSKHQEKVKRFRKCECVICYLPISSNLLKKHFRKTSLLVLAVTSVMDKSVLSAEYFKLLL